MTIVCLPGTWSFADVITLKATRSKRESARWLSGACPWLVDEASSLNRAAGFTDFDEGVTSPKKGAKADLVNSDREDSDFPCSEGGIERRNAERVDVTWSVDCEADDTFLYASIVNISEMGIFVQTMEPLDIGTYMTLRFAPPGHQPFVLRGIVQWVNTVRPLSFCPNPGMGVRFERLTAADRERLVEAIRTIAYVPFSTAN